jgi:Cu+-exporting ATPase
MDPDYLEQKPLTTPLDFQAKTGRGALGRIGNDTVAIGNRPFVKDMASISPQVERTMMQLEHDGKTAILASVNNEIKVVMGIADELKPDAGQTLRYLQDQMGIDVWMVTGDNSRTATAIANQLGLAQNRVISEALPVAKVQQVKKLQKEGKVVCMVGDGINDSAALAQANVGVSVGTGAEIAVEAADMVLVREGQVQEVVTALHLSRVIFRRIQLNFVFSLLYNCLGIPVAMGVFYPLVQVRLPPTLAAVAMALSSLSVVSSSLALKLYKPPKIDVQPTMMSQLFRRLSNSAVGNRQRTMSSSTVPVSNRRSASSRVEQHNSLREPLLTSSETLDEGQRMEEGLGERT